MTPRAATAWPRWTGDCAAQRRQQPAAPAMGAGEAGDRGDPADQGADRTDPPPDRGRGAAGRPGDGGAPALRDLTRPAAPAGVAGEEPAANGLGGAVLKGRGGWGRYHRGR